MIDPATGWFEIVQYNDKQAYTIYHLVEKLWLCRYPKPIIIMYCCTNIFLVYVLKNDLSENSSGITSKFATAKNS